MNTISETEALRSQISETLEENKFLRERVLNLRIALDNAGRQIAEYQKEKAAENG